MKPQHRATHLDRFWSFEGNLYADWNFDRPHRKDYDRVFRRIDCGRQLCSTLRSGPFVWPGGYSTAFVTNDGGVLCRRCVLDNLQSVIDSIRNRINDGWKVNGLIVECEQDEPEYCSHCGTCIFNDPAEA